VSVPYGVKKKRTSREEWLSGAAVAILLDARSRFCLIFYSVNLFGLLIRPEDKTED
jgi:hypothetical protein